jgi:hypothetical protein
MKPAIHYAIIRDARLRAAMIRRIKATDFAQAQGHKK